ncbi:hypothetical protein PFISCL1PPCAC_11262, partial [Pristionchus fissidentatus]
QRAAMTSRIDLLKSTNSRGEGSKSYGMLGMPGPGPIEGVNRANRDLVQYLYQPHCSQTDNAINSIEKSTALKREHVTYIAFALVGLFLCVGSAASFLCNLIGFGYPAYISVKAIRTPEKDDDTKWLTYWTVFGVFSVFDTFAEAILRFFPFYYLVKAAFLVYLYLPQTNGSEYLYTMYVDPLITKIDAFIASRRAPSTELRRAAN